MMRSVVLACLSAMAVACGGCSDEREPASAAATADTGASVVFQGSDGDVVVHVEIADTDKERAHGLMNRPEMAADHGMIFIFPSQRVQTFWMKNTLIPLDMVFVDRDRQIVGIVESAEPETLIERSVGVPSTYVIEVNGGFMREHGIANGSVVRFNHVL